MEKSFIVSDKNQDRLQWFIEFNSPSLKLYFWKSLHLKNEQYSYS